MTVITLIHGTFAKNAQWTKVDSPLAIALKDSVKGDVCVESLNWSGSNLHLSRYKASKALQAHIKALVEKHPSSKQFVIAHSHGGNVAMYALNDPSVRELTKGVITLSTPFILCRPRSIMPGILSLLLALMSISLFLFLGMSDLVNPYWLVAGLLLLWGVMHVGERCLSKFVLGRPNGLPLEMFQQLKESLTLAPLPTNKLLIVRAPGDEASAALGASTFGSWLCGKITDSMRAIQNLSEWLRGIKKNWSMLKQLICSVAILLAGIGIVSIGANYMESWFGYTLGFGVVIVIFALSFWFPFYLDYPSASGLDYWAFGLLAAYAIAVLPFLFLASLFSLAFGLDVALLAPWFEISVESSPVGRFSVLSLSAPTSKGLWHSLPYSDPESFRAIVDWINSSEDETLVASS